MDKIDLEKLEKIIELVEKKGLKELEIKDESGFSLKIVKIDRVYTVESSSKTSPLAAEVSKREPEVKEKGEKKKYHEIKSPMVGTFYRRPAPDQPPYVEVGDVVNPGDILCIIEAMKVMNEIPSDVKGKIVEIPVEDGQPVEYGQVLFVIEPIS